MHYRNSKKKVKTKDPKETKKKLFDNDLLLFHPGMDKSSLKRAFINCLRYEESKDFESAVDEDYLLSLAWSIKHRLVDRWIETQKHYHEKMLNKFTIYLRVLTGQL